jgi:hypothetical protein
MADTKQATEKMQDLKAEFQRIADDAGTRKFFQSWFDDAKQRKNDFTAFAAIAGVAEGLLAAEQSVVAKIPLDKLKELFDKRASALREGSRSFFHSWSGREEREAAQYEGYSKKLADVLKLL